MMTLQRKGKDVVVILSVEDYELLCILEDKVVMKTIRKIKTEPGEDSCGDLKNSVCNPVYNQAYQHANQFLF